eukprot:1273174-Lingulodinium_polyedra.AAC.1
MGRTRTGTLPDNAARDEPQGAQIIDDPPIATLRCGGVEPPGTQTCGGSCHFRTSRRTRGA